MCVATAMSFVYTRQWRAAAVTLGLRSASVPGTSTSRDTTAVRVARYVIHCRQLFVGDKNTHYLISSINLLSLANALCYSDWWAMSVIDFADLVRMLIFVALSCAGARLATHALSVCLSICLSHAGIDSKLMTVRPLVQFSLIDSRGTLVSWHQLAYVCPRKTLQPRLGRWVKSAKKTLHIRPINRHISETIEDGHIVTMED